MDVEDIIKLCMAVSLFLLPALAITVRFALKPIVDAILRLKEGGVLGASQASAEIPLLVAEVRHLRDEMSHLQHSVARLEDVASFHRSLDAPGAARAIRAPEE